MRNQAVRPAWRKGSTPRNNGLPHRALTRPCPPLRSGTCLRHVGNPETLHVPRGARLRKEEEQRLEAPPPHPGGLCGRLGSGR